MSRDKIVSRETLALEVDELKQQGKVVVLCHGTFDLLHIGHIRHLQRAAEEGDCLIVTVTADEYVNKGPGRPVFNAQLRAENLAALACVHKVAINHEVSAVSLLETIKPSVYAKGSDYKNAEEDLTGNILFEKNAVEKKGGRVFYSDELTSSSTHLLNEHFNVFSPEATEFLEHFKKNCSADDVVSELKDLKKLKVLVVGETIIDEYHYTSPLGQTGKGNVLAVKYENYERFAGGAIAVANHISGFVDQVTLLTGLGEEKSHETFILSQLKDNVSPQFYTIPGRPTIVKKRYVDSDIAKLFEVYYFDAAPLPHTINDAICSWFRDFLTDYDAVVVPDFGNGFITTDMIESLSQKARFLAVNAQINSGNHGYHAITRYPRADFLSMNEPELRLASHDRSSSLSVLASQLGEKLEAKQIAVTRGTKGAVMVDRVRDNTVKIPALSSKVVDRIGAGDAFLSIAGICLSAGISPENALFAGSAAAAMDVQIVCNRETIQPVSLFKYISTLLK